MRILIDARLYGLENAGLGRYAINLIRELQKIDKKNEYGVLLRKKYFDELKFPNNWTKILTDYRHYSIKEQIGLPKTISKFNPDLVHFLHFNVPVFYKGKFVVTIHDLLMHKNKGKKSTTLPSYSYHVKRVGYKLVFKKAATKATQIIAPSEEIKKEVADYYKLNPNNISVTYEGVDPAIKTSKDCKKIFKKYNIITPYFIYVGNAFPHKNLARAIEAVSLVKPLESQKKPVLLLITKKGIFIKRLEAKIKINGTVDSVKLIEHVSDKELGVLLSNSIGFVYPSLSEGFGLPALEAMSVGTLALVSDIPVFHEVYKNQAIYFNPYDFSSIQKAMQDTIEMDPKTRNKKIATNKRFVKKYSWKKTAEQTLKIYENCASL